MKKLFSLLIISGIALSICSCGGSNDTESAPATYSIEGTVSVDETPSQSITVVLSGASNGSTVTDSSGKYKFTSLKNGSYTVTPVNSTGTTSTCFDATNSTVTINGANATGKNFDIVANTAYSGGYQISGNVTASTGTPISNALITLKTGTSPVYMWTVQTDASGDYAVTGLLDGTSITLKAISASYSFFPEICYMTVNTNPAKNIQNFTGTSTAAAFYLHFTFPDQYNWTTNYPSKTAAEAEPLLFAGKTLTEVVDAAYAEFGITSISFNGTTYDYADNEDLYMCSLDQFIDQETVNSQTPLPKGIASTYFTNESLDARELYACVPVSNMDGFSIRTKFIGGMYPGYGDLSYSQFATDGYLATVVTNPKLWWPNGTGSTAPYSGWAANLYACTYPYDLYMLRIIDVIRSWENTMSAATTINKFRTARFEVEATTSSYVNDTYYTPRTSKFNVTTLSVTVGGQTYSSVRAISLGQFITTYVMALTDAQSATYAINNLKGDSTAASLSYIDLQAAYFLPDYNVAVLGYSSGTASSQVYFPTQIEVDGSATSVTANGLYTGYISTNYAGGYTYATYPAPAFAVCPGE